MNEPIPFTPAFLRRHPFGWLAGVHLPGGFEPVPEAALAALAPAEAAHARTLRLRRQLEWVGGRMALRQAARAAGLDLPAVLPRAGGGPALPAGVQASISHKRRLAVALIAPGGGTLGIDLEESAPARESIASKVLRPEELQVVEALPGAARWDAIVRRFATKEAIYKALHPHVDRFVAFAEASVSLDPPAATLHLARGEGPFSLEIDLGGLEGYVLAAVRLAQAGGGGESHG